MTLKETLKELAALSDPKTKALNTKYGVGDNQYGVKLGDLRTVAKKLKTNHALALELWATENFDARMLALLIIVPKQLTAAELDAMVRSIEHRPAADWMNRTADWLSAYVVKVHPDNESLRLKWMKDKHPLALRAGWDLTAQRVARQPELVDIPALLVRIEREMGQAAPETQWTMNSTLAGIGIHHPEHRQRALAIGEKLGVYRNYPVSKGCTSPFAPSWINEMVKRQG